MIVRGKSGVIWGFQTRQANVLVAAIFIAVLAALTSCEEGARPSIERASEPGYTGLARCAMCHTNLYSEWRQSLHSRAMGVPADSTVVGDFDNAEYTYGGVTSRMYRDGDDYYMDTLGPEGDIRPYRVDYTVGVRQHQAYLTTFPDGRLQVLPVYHDGKQNRWIDAQEGKVVESDKPLRPGDFYFWANRGRSWNYHCYDCHASRVEKHYDPAADKYETTVGSLTIDCESCHGPGQVHDHTRETPGADLNMVDLERLPVDEQIEVCAQCHAAKDVIAKGYAAGEPFYDHYTLHLPDDETFYPDGQPRVYLYPVALHLMSSCYTEGDLVCTSCHDPHGSDYAVDLIADKRTTALCAGCHEEIAADPSAHSRHGFGSEGNTCVGCHMPYHHVTGEEMTDHRIVSPSPRNTKLFGVPNSCNAAECHVDESADWAAEYVDAWFPGFQDREEARVRPYALGKQGHRSAINDLRERLRSDLTMPVWKAVAATLLGTLSAESAVEDLIARLNDPYPMVRLRSAIALGRIGDARAILPLVGKLEDEVRPVRIYSAFALSDLGYRPPKGMASENYRLALAEYEAMVNDLHRDDPGLLDGLGELRERAGRYTQARKLFERIRKLDPSHPETESDLSRISFLEEAFSKWELVLKEAVEAAPEDFEARGRLGRFYADHHRIEPAGIQLRGAAARLNSPAVFLAEARVSAAEGDVEGATHSVLRALESRPRHRTAATDLVRLTLSRQVEQQLPDLKVINAWASWETGYQHARAGDWSEASTSFGRASAIESALLGADSADVRDLIGVTRGGSVQLDRWAGRAFEAGSVAFGQGQLVEAEQHFRDCVALSPSDPRGHLLLALVLDEQGKGDGAAWHAMEAALLDPTLPDAYGVLGTIAQNARQVDKAIVHYTTALAFSPESPGVRLNLSQLYMVKGQPELARTVLQELLSFDPQNEDARQLLRQIDGT